MKKFYKIIFVSILFVLCGCDHSCQYWLNEFKNKSYFFSVKRIYIDGKYNVIEGRDKNNKFVEFFEIGFDEIFNSAKIGDTIKKEKDSTTLYIIKKDTILAFPRKCK